MSAWETQCRWAGRSRLSKGRGCGCTTDVSGLRHARHPENQALFLHLSPLLSRVHSHTHPGTPRSPRRGPQMGLCASEEGPPTWEPGCARLPLQTRPGPGWAGLSLLLCLLPQPCRHLALLSPRLLGAAPTGPSWGTRGWQRAGRRGTAHGPGSGVGGGEQHRSGTRENLTPKPEARRELVRALGTPRGSLGAIAALARC